MTGTQHLRLDLQVIAEMIPPDVRVLDIGCGDGALLEYLVQEKGIDGRGIELSQPGVNACVARGLSVVQGDADTDLANYPAGAFDFVVLSQTLQATRNPREVILELVRIGKSAVVSFTNFGHWRLRRRFLLGGRLPVGFDTLAGTVTGGNVGLPQDVHWYDTPNIHLCTIRDFVDLCDELDLRVERAVSINRQGGVRPLARVGAMANLRGQQGVFLLTRNGS